MALLTELERTQEMLAATDNYFHEVIMFVAETAGVDLDKIAEEYGRLPNFAVVAAIITAINNWTQTVNESPESQEHVHMDQNTNLSVDLIKRLHHRIDEQDIEIRRLLDQVVELQEWVGPGVTGETLRQQVAVSRARRVVIEVARALVTPGPGSWADLVAAVAALDTLERS